MDRTVPVVLPRDRAWYESEMRDALEQLSGMRDTLRLLASSSGLPSWAREAARNASWNTQHRGFACPDGAPLPFPVDAHVVLIEDDHPTNPTGAGGQPIIWETPMTPRTAPDLEQSVAMAERWRGRYGRWIVCKLVPVVSSGPEGWVEVDRAGEPVRSQEQRDFSMLVDAKPLRMRPRS